MRRALDDYRALPGLRLRENVLEPREGVRFFAPAEEAPAHDASPCAEQAAPPAIPLALDPEVPPRPVVAAVSERPAYQSVTHRGWILPPSQPCGQPAPLGVWIARQGKLPAAPFSQSAGTSDGKLDERG